jgi:hypothetical protein
MARAHPGDRGGRLAAERGMDYAIEPAQGLRGGERGGPDSAAVQAAPGRDHAGPEGAGEAGGKGRIPPVERMGGAVDGVVGRPEPAQVPGQRGLARSRAARDPDHYSVHVSPPPYHDPLLYNTSP